MKVFGKAELEQMIFAFKKATTKEERADIFKQATKILNAFANNKIDIEGAALDTFGDFLETFGTRTNKKGERVLTAAGARATAAYEGIINRLENQISEAETNRIYAKTSDENQIKFNQITLKIYQEMGLADKNLDINNLSPAAVAKTVEDIKLDKKQQQEYSMRFVDAIMADKDLFESVPPAILTDAYVYTRDAIATASEKDKPALLKRFGTLGTRMDALIKEFNDMRKNWFMDPFRVIDYHDGYIKMMDQRQKDIAISPELNKETQEYNTALNQEIEQARQALEELITEYDQLYNLTQLHPENAEELKERWTDLKKRLSEMEVSDYVLQVAAKYQFLDENNNPIPQFLNENNQPSLEYKTGYTVNPNGRLAQMLKLSKNDVTMQNVGKLDTPVADMNLQKDLDVEVPYTVAEISVPDQIVQGIIQDPSKYRNEESVKQFWDNINTNGGNISDQGWQDALDAHTNNAAGFAQRLSQKIGPDKDVVYAPLETVEEIDKLAQTRTEQNGAKNRQKKVGFFKRMLKNFGMGAAVAGGLTFIGKATGVAYIGAAIGTTIGIGNMIYQGVKWRKEQKKQGKPYGVKDFFADKRNWGPAVTTGLATAAVISMATGNPELAAGFGMGAMATGAGTTAVATYKDAINAGYSRGQALAGALGVGVSGALGAMAGSAAMNGIVNYVNNNTDSTLFKTEQITEQTRTGYETHQERVYSDGVIENNERILNMWEKPDVLDARIDALMDAGLNRDDSIRYLMAFHDATDHNLGPDYFNSIGMSDDALAALRSSINGTEVNLTPESMAAFEHFNPHISATNTVGYYEGAPVINGLPANASFVDGQLVPGNSVYSTFVNHDTPVYSYVDVATPIQITEMTSVFTPNELAFPAGIGTMGIYEPRVISDGYHRALKERAGALIDRTQKIQNQQQQPDIIKPVTPENDTEEEKGKPIDWRKRKRKKKTNTDTNDQELPFKQEEEENTPEPHDGTDEPMPDDGKKKRKKKKAKKEDMPVEQEEEENNPEPHDDTDKPVPDNDDKDKPTPQTEKRGFFESLKDTVYDVMRATGNAIDRVVRKSQQIVHDAKMRRIKNVAERTKEEAKLEEAKTEHEAAKRKRKKEEGMTKEQDLKQKNREQAIKLQGQIDAEIARLNAELKKDSIKNDHKRAEEIKQAKHALEILKQNIKHAQAATKASKDLLEEKKLELAMARIQAKIDKETAKGKASENYYIGQGKMAKVWGALSKPLEALLDSYEKSKVKTKIAAEEEKRKKIERTGHQNDAESERKISEVKAETGRNKGRKIGNAIRGLRDKTKADADSVRFEEAMKRIKAISADKNLSEAQKRKAIQEIQSSLKD